MARHRKVTVWPRVSIALGLNVVAVVPVVMPSETAQRIASA